MGPLLPPSSPPLLLYQLWQHVPLLTHALIASLQTFTRQLTNSRYKSMSFSLSYWKKLFFMLRWVSSLQPLIFSLSKSTYPLSLSFPIPLQPFITFSNCTQSNNINAYKYQLFKSFLLRSFILFQLTDFVHQLHRGSACAIMCEVVNDLIPKLTSTHLGVRSWPYQPIPTKVSIQLCRAHATVTVSGSQDQPFRGLEASTNSLLFPFRNFWDIKMSLSYPFVCVAYSPP